VIYVNSLLIWTSAELFKRVQVHMANNLNLAEGETHKKPIAQKHLPFHKVVQPTEVAYTQSIYIYFPLLQQILILKKYIYIHLSILEYS